MFLPELQNSWHLLMSQPVHGLLGEIYVINL